MFKTGIGQDSHRLRENQAGDARPLILAGICLPEPYSLEGNSDSDVIFHAVTNALSGITGKPILGPVADALCKDGVTNSAAYLALALSDVATAGYRITHVSVTVECRKPKLIAHFPAMRASLASRLRLAPGDVAITATSGEGLTDFGRGEGVQAFAVASAIDARLFSPWT